MNVLMSRPDKSMSDIDPSPMKVVNSKRRDVMRLGYIGLADAAPLFVAKDFGLFERHGLDVTLHREVGWATIREKVIYGELEAAHALCPLPFSARLGVNSVSAPCHSGVVLSRGGNAIIFSEELWKRGVRDQASLRLDISNRRAFRRYIFASVFPHSTHAFLLRDWLKGAGLDPDEDVEMVTLPPAQMCRSLAAGTIDGFCAGEPWGSLAISEGTGWSPAVSTDIAPGHPEKVLMARDSLAEEQPEKYIALVASLIEASYLCEQGSFREAIVAAMADRRRVNCDASLLAQCLYPSYNYGFGKREAKPGFIRFHQGDSNRPRQEDAAWIVDRLDAASSGGIDAAMRGQLLSKVLREDIYEAALAQVDLQAALSLSRERVESVVVG